MVNPITDCMLDIKHACATADDEPSIFDAGDVKCQLKSFKIQFHKVYLTISIKPDI